MAAGIVVGIVALPLAIAFGIASGVSPEKGLITAIVAGFLISALGGSRVQIGGPTGAFIVLVYGIVHRYGTDGLVAATFLAGILLVLAGLTGLGSLIRYVPRPVITGFTSGIAVIIFSSQVRDALGLRLESLPPDFIGKWVSYLGVLGSANAAALAVCASTVIFMTLWNRYFRRVPAALIAILAASAAVHFFKLPVETIGTRFGDLPNALPAPRVPSLSPDLVLQMFGPAFSIALLAAIESLLSAIVADGMIQGRHRSNTELIAQGLANVGSGLFGGIPATGAIARTATNVKSGAKTPVAGLVHALTLLIILYFFAPHAKLIPLSCLAGILLIVAYHMSEWRPFLRSLQGEKAEAAVLLVTFFLTVFADLTVAIATGTALSLVSRGKRVLSRD